MKKTKQKNLSEVQQLQNDLAWHHDLDANIVCRRCKEEVR